MPRNLADRITSKLQELAKSPYSSSQVKLLKGMDACRLRVGDWRIIYTVQHDALEIWVIKIASRGDIY